MISIIKKLLVFIGLAVLIFGLWGYSVRSSDHTVSTKKTHSGWVYNSGENNVFLTQLGISVANSRLVICDDNVVFLNKRTTPVRVRGFQRNRYEIVAIAIASGVESYRTSLDINGSPLQIEGLWSWKHHAVIWGYHQVDIGLERRQYSISIIDSDGKLTGRFPVDSLMRPLTVDNQNNQLICLEQRKPVMGAQPREETLPPQSIKFFILPEGKETNSEPVRMLVDMICDDRGNAYVLRHIKGINKTNIEITMALNAYDMQLEVFTADTWGKLWSARINRTPNRGSGFPRTMLKPVENTLWVTMQDELFHKRWNSTAYDIKTGNIIETETSFNPFSFNVRVREKNFVIKRDWTNNKGSIVVTAGMSQQ